MFVTRQCVYAVALQDGGAEADQRLILLIFKHAVFDSFELNADRVVIAVALPPVARHSRVPGPVIGADKLEKLTRATDVEVRGHGHALDTFKVGVLVPVELIGKQAKHLIAPVLAREIPLWMGIWISRRAKRLRDETPPNTSVTP